MINFCGSVTLAAGTPKTILELITAAVTARTYGSAEIETDEINRLSPGIASEGFMRTSGADVYLMDGYKGLTNGSADTTSPLVVGDFTAAPGGGMLIEPDSTIHFNNGVSLGSRVLYSAAGATLYLDISMR